MIVVIVSLVVAAETDPDENLTQFSHNVSHRDYYDRQRGSALAPPVEWAKDHEGESGANEAMADYGLHRQNGRGTPDPGYHQRRR